MAVAIALAEDLAAKAEVAAAAIDHQAPTKTTAPASTTATTAPVVPRKKNKTNN